MKKIMILMCVLLSGASFANTSVKSDVLKVALNYGNSVHCGGAPYHENQPLKSVFEIDEDYYAVLQFVDLYCSGGSGTGAYILTPVNYHYGRHAAIDVDDYPSGDMFENLNINTKNVENVTYDPKSKQLSFIHYEYDDKDGNCCPSLKYRTTINLKNNKIVSHKLLGKQK